MTTQSDKLPSYLRPLLRFQPARPSTISSGPGSDALGRTQNTWKPPDQSSLHNVCRTGIQLKADANVYFFKGYLHHRLGSYTKRIGGAERDRTADPLLAKQVLSQLSYSPNHFKHPSGKTLRDQY